MAILRERKCSKYGREEHGDFKSVDGRFLDSKGYCKKWGKSLFIKGLLCHSIKKQRHYFAKKVCLVKVMVFPVVMYGCERVGLQRKLSPKELMPSNHLILCHPLLLLPAIPPSIRVFSNESALHTRLPKNWSLSASTSVLPMNIRDWSPLGWTGWISLQSKGLSRVFSNTTVQKHPFFST